MGGSSKQRLLSRKKEQQTGDAVKYACQVPRRPGEGLPLDGRSQEGFGGNRKIKESQLPPGSGY